MPQIHREHSLCTINRDPKTHQNPIPAHLEQRVLEDLIRKRRNNTPSRSTKLRPPSTYYTMYSFLRLITNSFNI